jgi:hypothetical protein
MMLTGGKHVISFVMWKGRGWEEDRLTSAHLLSNHDDTRCLGGAAKTGDGEEFEETGDHIAALCQATLLQQHLLILELGVDEVQVTSSLKRAIAESKERLVSLANLAFLHQPTG